MIGYFLLCLCSHLAESIPFLGHWSKEGERNIEQIDNVRSAVFGEQPGHIGTEPPRRPMRIGVALFLTTEYQDWFTTQCLSQRELTDKVRKTTGLKKLELDHLSGVSWKFVRCQKLLSLPSPLF